MHFNVIPPDIYKICKHVMKKCTYCYFAPIFALVTVVYASWLLVKIAAQISMLSFAWDALCETDIRMYASLLRRSFNFNFISSQIITVF